MGEPNIGINIFTFLMQRRQCQEYINWLQSWLVIFSTCVLLCFENSTHRIENFHLHWTTNTVIFSETQGWYLNMEERKINYCKSEEIIIMTSPPKWLSFEVYCTSVSEKVHKRRWNEMCLVAEHEWRSKWKKCFGGQVQHIVVFSVRHVVNLLQVIFKILPRKN